MSRKEEILARCIDEVLSGRKTVEGCLERYPELRDELKPLLKVALSLQPPKVTPSPEFRQRARKRLLEVMEPAKTARVRKEVTHRWFAPVLTVRAMATFVLAFIVLTAGAGSVYAAQSSLPGDVLYPVKVGAEKLQVAVTVNPEDKAYLHLEQAQRRIDEVAIQVSLNRSPDVSGLATLPAQTDAALHEIEKVSANDASAFLSRLAESTINQQVTLSALLPESPESEHDTMQQAISVVQRTNLIAQAAYNNSAFLHTGPSASDESLEKGRFTVDGTLLSVDGKTWNIGGVVLSDVHYSGETPAINSRVKVEGLNKNNQVYIFKLEQEEDTQMQGSSTQEEVKIGGFFKGTDESGKTWYVGEVAIAAPEDKALPAQGDQLEVQGTTQDGSLAVTGVKKGDEGEQGRENEAKLEGKLSKVDATNKIITVHTAGAKISLNISSAKIYTKDRKEIKLSDLGSLVGKDIKASGLTKKDDTLFAREVRVDVENWSRNSSGDRDKENSHD